MKVFERKGQKTLLFERTTIWRIWW